MSRAIALRLAYEGTRYHGWQIQPGLSTVQGTLAEAIRAVTGEDVLPRGSSRTDAGVHALDQIAAFSTTSALDAATWRRALDARLPADITVVAAAEVDPDFDPVTAAVAKTYRYRIHDAPWKPLLDRHLVWRWRGPLDAAAMGAAAAELVGEHDFTSFEKTPSSRVSKTRTIHRLDVARRSSPAGKADGEVWVEVTGNGFLHNMVRIIVGSLVFVGSGRRGAGWLAEVVAARDRGRAGPTAPPEGLVLLSTELPPGSPLGAACGSP